ncbi:MAG: O-antigen ligase family protein [Candidatus Methanoperedens sp.]|nr:O-antigen ligase family protein [Candidatus Methanoperedens sp.]
MIKNTGFIINQQTSIKDGIADRQIIWGIIIVFIGAIAAILSSKLGLGLLSVWPVIILFFVFVKHYELGLICFVLSFAYQAPVIFAPSFGLSAIIRLDEMIFVSIFPVWLLRKSVRQEKSLARSPLRNPLLFYALIAFLSLLVRYNEISSTPFLHTGTGMIGLSPLILRLFEVVGGYLMLTDQWTAQKTQQSLFRCLHIVAGFAVVFSSLASHGFLPKDFFGIEMYDPYAWLTRFSLYGNTSAWGVLLVIYFLILLYWFLYFKPVIGKIVFILLMILCVDAILISGTKTAMISLMVGLILLMIRESKNFKLSTRMLIIAFIIVSSGMWFLEQFATAEQKREVYGQLESAYVATGIRGFEKAYHETSLGSRFDNWGRFVETVQEEPELLVLGRGWQRRAIYETGISLHADLLTSTHDMGILGAVFVIWLYFKMFTQFSIKIKQPFSTGETKLLNSIMQILVLLIIASSFSSENLTLYPGIDVQFPFIITIMAITWSYIRGLNYRTI